MNESDTQLSQTQVCGMLLLGLCVWAIIIGIILVVLNDIRDGAIVTLAGVMGTGVLIKWLTYIKEG